MCGLVSAEPSAGGCGVCAMRPSGVTRSDSRSRPRLPPASNCCSRLLLKAASRRSNTRSTPGALILPPPVDAGVASYQPRCKKRRGSPEAHMLVGKSIQRVAILGGVRTPFARSHTAFAGTDNQELLTASLRALVERFELQGQRLGGGT